MSTDRCFGGREAGHVRVTAGAIETFLSRCLRHRNAAPFVLGLDAQSAKIVFALVVQGTMADDETTEAPRPVTPPPAENPSSDILHGLLILPPRQQNATSPTDALALPPIRAEEPVQSIRAALTEVIGLAHITNYRLELETEPPSSIKAWDPPLVSPWTGPDAVVCNPTSVKALDEEADLTPTLKVLDDWGDLTPLLEQGLRDGSAFSMVLQRYDAGAVKDHVLRLRSLMAGSAPSVTALHEEGTKVVEVEKKTEEDKPGLPDLDPSKLSGTNVKDFFYLACGEDPETYHQTAASPKPKKKKKKGNGKETAEEPVPEVTVEQAMREQIMRWNQLEDLSRVDCQIRYSGFHPPSSSRKLVGDLAYLEMIPPAGAAVIHVTAVPTGFYVNRSSSEWGKKPIFDPTPAVEPFFSHSLLDSLLQASSSFHGAWVSAITASKERQELTSTFNKSNPFLSLFRMAVRADFEGFESPASAASAVRALDANLQTPSWLVPPPNPDLYAAKNGPSWTGHQFHSYQPLRAEEDLSHTFGTDLRQGGSRDWNEELQLAREMPTTTQLERIERARLLHKVLTEFGEASLLGVKAISEGYVTPMNPNETMRTQVYLHNNIFFSRAIDAGPETFKLARGDRAARKAANRDLQCISMFHRMEKIGISTLATVLIDYLGTRFVCQSVLPGILIGERAHQLVYGAVESGVPLKWDKELHELLEEKLGDAMMIATRPAFRHPLTEEYLEELDRLKNNMPAIAEPPPPKEEEVEPDAVMMTCIPIDAKGILGSDKRKYLLDFGRVAPRDANWVPKDVGGTGKWEDARKENGRSSTAIPLSLNDPEWSMCTLRSELVTKFTRLKMAKLIAKQREEEAEKVKSAESDNDKDALDTDKPKEQKEATDEEESKDTVISKKDLEHMKSLRLNVNAFIPNLRSFEGVNSEAAEQIKQDEENIREASIFLWDEMLPKLTKAVKEGQVSQLPLDGRALSEFLHRQGVNCRYLGRLAVLAQEQEDRDRQAEIDLKNKRLAFFERKTMPKFWLELLETEMVARAAKHILDSYLLEDGGVAACQPAQTIAAFLSALVSESEETAAQTETRQDKRGSDEPDDEDFALLSISGTGGDGDAVPPPIRSRHEVWQDIELEIGRRFRYSLTIYNNGNKSGRARHVPLLRRVCQRTGVRLFTKSYDVGRRCLCSIGMSQGGRLTETYPISPLDIAEVVPLMKHAAAANEGFHPCSLSPTVTLPPLHVSAPDPRLTLERAHIQTSHRALNAGLELAQEALSLYQRVTESAAHPGVIDCIDLMASIFYEGGDANMAVSHGEKALGLSIQMGGFDNAIVLSAHMAMYQFLFAAKEIKRSIKHLCAVVYLADAMCSPLHSEVYNAIHKLATTYAHFQSDRTALKFFDECFERDPADRLMEGITSKARAAVLANMEEYKDAVASEKIAYQILTMMLGPDHQFSKECEEELKKYTQLAVEKGNRSVENEKMKDEAARADAVAADLMAAELKEKKKNKKKKGKK